MKNKARLIHPTRRLTIVVSLALMVSLLVWRAVDLQVTNNSFLQEQGHARYLRPVSIAAHRGMITDRNGEPLAISTPVDSIGANPQELSQARDQWPRLAPLLGMDVNSLESYLEERAGKKFIYLKRRIIPELAEQVMALGVPGVELRREYRRYYPAGEVAAHVIGMTDYADVGQEGLELAYEEWLRGTPGSKRVLKDNRGHIVEDVESISEPSPGKDLTLSIDRGIQYLAYRELKAAMSLHNARAGSAVILDAQSGEVLAMVNQPSYNPNNRNTLRFEQTRNRAVTDVFEPGSTIKPFTIAAALESGKYRPESIISTAPGYFRVGKNTVRDIRDYGDIDVTTIIQKSSNVGASKLALAIEPEQLWNVFSRVGFGGLSGSSYPGEVSGLLSDHWRWHDIERATLAFGYGVSVTPLQLARAYMVLADQGRIKPVSLLPVAEDTATEYAISPRTAKQVLAMMETVVTEEGTGVLARTSGYRVAGKTGTVQKSAAGGYSDERYVSLFAGIAPASRPRLVMAVMIDEPRNEEYYGGRVAAPVFAKVMAGALRLYGIAPDDVPTAAAQHVAGRGKAKTASGML